MSDVSLEEGYCPKCGKRKVMTKIKEDGTSYKFCKACDWNNKTVSLKEKQKCTTWRCASNNRNGACRASKKQYKICPDKNLTAKEFLIRNPM